MAFSPEAGAEALVVKVISAARTSVRLAGYSFTSPVVVRSLMDAKRRGIDVKVVIDDKGNRGQANLAAINSIHHDKYIVVDGKTTETGSFNFSQAAAKSNSENVLVVWDDPVIAARYLHQWESRWKQGIDVEGRY